MVASPRLAARRCSAGSEQEAADGIVLPPSVGVEAAESENGPWRFTEHQENHADEPAEAKAGQIRTRAIDPETLAIERFVEREAGSGLVKRGRWIALGRVALFDDGLKVYATWTPIEDQTRRLSESALPVVAIKSQSTGNTVRLRPTMSAPETTASHQSVMFVLDASGSMSGDRIAQAKEALRTTVLALPRESEAAVVVLSGCGQIQALAPFTDDFERLLTKVAPVRPGGGTPLGEAIDVGFRRLHKNAQYQISQRQLVVLSDGRPTCGRSPDEVIANWPNAQRTGQHLTVIGLEVNAQDAEALRRLAKHADGVYRQTDRESLGRVMRRAIQRENDQR